MHVTPSAVSQRLKALEVATGRVLLVRKKPVQVTASGQTVLRLARQVGMLVADAAGELGSPQNQPYPSVIALAVNADSLATWVLAGLAPLAGAFRFDLHREDQAHTSALLRDGTVMAAITAEVTPVPGCSSTRLGTMRYRPMAAPDFAARWFPDGVTAGALLQAPMINFDRDDKQQRGYVRDYLRGPAEPLAHYVPSSADFLRAVLLGLGWGMVPDLQSAADERAQRLVDLDPQGASDVLLYWQQWQLQSASLKRVADAVIDAARHHLRP